MCWNTKREKILTRKQENSVFFGSGKSKPPSPFLLPPLPTLLRFNSTGTRSRRRKFNHFSTIGGERQRVLTKPTNHFFGVVLQWCFSQILRQFESSTQTGKKMVNEVPKEGGCRHVGRRGGGWMERKIESRIFCSRTENEGREEGPG